MMASGYDSAAGICWVHRNRVGCTCPVHSVGYGKRALVWFGHCKSGRRWFWMAGGYDVSERAFGWEGTEALAIAAAMTMVRRVKQPGLPMLAYFDPGMASRTLKKLKKTKKRRPPRSAPRTSFARPVRPLQGRQAPPPPAPAPPQPDLAALKAAAVAVHPDRGGSNAAFDAAWKRYEAAEKASRSKGAP